MLLVVLGLLILWAALAVLGLLVKAMLWLTVMAGGLFLATLVAGIGMYLGNCRK